MRLHIRALGKFARLATLACLCVSFAPIWAAENAYVSVMASSGQVVCDGLDFYVVPTAVGHASGGGCCGWLVAVEIAMLGTQGISPDKHEGYKLKSIPGEDFSGYRMLAHYYVSWARVFPDKLSLLQLPFDDAYAAAKSMYEMKNRGNGKESK